MSTNSESEASKKQIERSMAKCDYCRQKKIKVGSCQDAALRTMLTERTSVLLPIETGLKVKNASLAREEANRAAPM